MRGFYTLCFLCLISGTTCQHWASNVTGRVVESAEPVNGIRIAWDYTTLKQLSPVGADYSGYPRMIKLKDGSLFCVYESDGAVHAINSDDGGRHWREHRVIAAPLNGIACVVPEVLQLKDQSLLVSYNLRPPVDNTDPKRRFSIEVIRSCDGGDYWAPPVEVFKAGYEFKNGCWEPAQIQLPTGEIQLFIANEGPYTQSNEQEITMFRSADHGATWLPGKTVSFRRGHRDGMPVPLLLANQEIIVAIEDNGIDGRQFKPAIIRTTTHQNWSNAPVLSSDKSREYALGDLQRIPEPKYAGAPYIRQLASGEVLLSYQGNERRKDFQWDRSDMIVSIGSPEGRNFNRKSTPFYISDSSKTALWNSLCVENDSTVIALSSTNAYGKTSVWMIKGYVIPEIQSPHISTSINEGLLKMKSSVFIGGFGPTQAKIYTAWNKDVLFLTADVSDQNILASGDVEKDDGMQFFLDPQNRSLTFPDENIFSIRVTAAGQCLYRQGKDGRWVNWNPSGIKTTAQRTPMGYRIEMTIPWGALHHIPVKEKRIGLHAVVLETSTGLQHDYIEPLGGNVTDASYTWSPLFLTK